MRVFGWIWVVLGLIGLVGVVMGAWWHGLSVVMCAVMGWGCFHEAREEGINKA